MKVFKFLLLVLAAGSTLFFANCGGGSEEPTQEEVMRNTLVNNSPWTLSSVALPPVNATEESEWANFTVSFTNTNMTTSNYPVGASAVWPTSAWSFTSDLSGIIRASDGVTMTINTLNESTLNVTFTIPEGTEIGGRVAALDGEYTFDME